MAAFGEAEKWTVRVGVFRAGFGCVLVGGALVGMGIVGVCAVFLVGVFGDRLGSFGRGREVSVDDG